MKPHLSTVEPPDLALHSRNILAFLPVLLFFSTLVAAQQPSSMLTVVGPAKTLTITSPDWADLPKTTVRATNGHDKTTSTYSGVLLRDLLHQAGVPSGEALRGRDLAACVRLTAKDGYVAVFALGELDPSIRDEDVLVADTKDGKPLADNRGPLQLIVPADKRPARWIRMLTRVEVVNMKQP